MAHIKEPRNINFVVNPIEYTEEQRKITSDAIKLYKQKIAKRKPVKIKIVRTNNQN